MVMRNKVLRIIVMGVCFLVAFSCKGFKGHKNDDHFKQLVNEFSKVAKAGDNQPVSYEKVIKYLPSNFEEVAVLRKKMISKGYPDILSVSEIRDSITSFVESGKMMPPVNISSWHLYYCGMNARTMRAIRRKSNVVSAVMDTGYKMAYRDYVMTIDVPNNVGAKVADLLNNVACLDKNMLKEFPESFSDFYALLSVSNDCICDYLYESSNIERSELMTKFTRIASGGIWYADGVSYLYQALLDYIENQDGVGVILSELNKHSKNENEVFWSMVFGGPAPENYYSDKEAIKKLLNSRGLCYSFMDAVDKGYSKALLDASEVKGRQMGEVDNSKSHTLAELWNGLLDCGDSLYRYRSYVPKEDKRINYFLVRIDYPLL